MIIVIKDKTVRWRVFERDALEQYFGEVIECLPEDNLPDADAYFWKLDTEGTDVKEFRDACEKYYPVADRFNINPPTRLVFAQCKDFTFRQWEKDKINCPKHELIPLMGAIDRVVTAFRYDFKYPYILRLNDCTGGQASHVIQTLHQAQSRFRDLDEMARKKKEGILTRIIAEPFIETLDDKHYVRSSYRIIVAGNEVITGYARLCRPPDWVAITSGGKFDIGMWGAFLEYQRRCELLITEYKDEIIRAVKSLGLNFQGVDLIRDRQGEIYFLEVQPGFSAGYADPESGFRPPYYNPSFGPLVNLIKDRYDELPETYKLWLDKKSMFNRCFEALKGEMDATKAGH